MIDISREDAVLVDGKPLPVALLRALAAGGSGRIRIEFDDASAEEIEVSRLPGGQTSFARSPRSRSGNDVNPLETEFRAELVSPDRQARQWVTRGDVDDSRLRRDGWTEDGVTRKRVPLPPEEPEPLADQLDRRP